MKQKIKLGVVCLARNTFDYPAAEKLYAGILDDLKKQENVELVAVEGLVFEPSQAVAAGEFLASRLVDGIAVVSGTFHLGHLALEIKKLNKSVPLLLWGLPELPYNGGKIRLNSVCGVNMNASNLVKSGYSDFTYTVSGVIDENWVDAVRMLAALKRARIGIIGYRADGFFNVGTDELALYGKFGCLVDHFELSELFDYAALPEDVAKYTKKLGVFDLCGVTASQTEKVALLAAKLKKFVDDKGLSVLAIRCWPEFAKGFGISPCASMSLVQDEGYILACEGDVDCGLTMLCHRAAGAETPFMADLSQVNTENNSALMWHCGVAPCGLTDGRCKATLDTYFAGGKGVTAGFVMKSGQINMARLDSINGEYRLFQEKGESVPMDKLLTGTYAKVTFADDMKTVLDRVIYSGLAHHVSMVYGDYTETFKVFARLAGVKEI